MRFAGPSTLAVLEVLEVYSVPACHLIGAHAYRPCYSFQGVQLLVQRVQPESVCVVVTPVVAFVSGNRKERIRSSRSGWTWRRQQEEVMTRTQGSLRVSLRPGEHAMTRRICLHPAEHAMIRPTCLRPGEHAMIRRICLRPAEHALILTCLPGKLVMIHPTCLHPREHALIRQTSLRPAEGARTCLTCHHHARVGRAAHKQVTTACPAQRKSRMNEG